MFNEYNWKLYLHAGGDQIVEAFRKNLTEELTKEFIATISELHRAFSPDEIQLNDEAEQIKRLIAALQKYRMEQLDANSQSNNSSDADELDDSAEKIFDDFYYFTLLEEGEYSDKDAFVFFIENIVGFSMHLAIEYPGFFIPYFFRYNFNILANIAEVFEIKIPAIPVKKNYKERIFYYVEICKALKDFQHEKNLDDFELCAFLYDFAPKFIGGVDSYIIDEDKLPEAKSAFFIGSSKKDRFYTEQPDAITIWQCNPETRAGDMIVMYLLTPDSAIRSVWRSRSVGFNDPFFYYYRCTYIGNPVQIKQITLADLHKDKILSAMGIVRKNMQGINGVELKPSEFNHILDLAGADLPRLEYELPESDSKFSREKDVEKLLIKPLLHRLGYEEADYVQQLYIEIGNHNHALIPDFVLLPKKTQGRQNAFAVIEAKLSISNQKQLSETIIQARSYAKLLGTKYQMIASKEKIWLYSADDDYANEIFVATWNQLHDADMFSQLYKLVGKR